MIAALERLRQLSDPSHLPAEMAAFGIRGGGGLTKLFMTHPPLEERIAARSTKRRTRRSCACRS